PAPGVIARRLRTSESSVRVLLPSCFVSTSYTEAPVHRRFAADRLALELIVKTAPFDFGPPGLLRLGDFSGGDRPPRYPRASGVGLPTEGSTNANPQTAARNPTQPPTTTAITPRPLKTCVAQIATTNMATNYT